MKEPKKILISHISNFFDKKVWHEPELDNKTSYYAYPFIKNYFLDRMEKGRLPFHYYVYNIKDDWDVISAMPDDYKSYWTEDLIDSYYLDPSFHNCIVIAVQDNFSLNTVSSRMSKVLGYNVLSPLIRKYRPVLDFYRSVHWFDEVFDFDQYDKDMDPSIQLKNKYTCQVNKMKFFDRIPFNIDVLPYL